MVDELVPFADPIRLPAPADLTAQLREALSAAVAAERDSRGEVRQPEDVSPLVRQLAGAVDVLGEYGHAFTQTAALARKELTEELYAAVGEQNEVPNGPLTVQDVDGTDIHLTPEYGNVHDIDGDQVIAALIAQAIFAARDTEPEQGQDESEEVYLERYEVWMAALIREVVDKVLSLGSFSMQITKVNAARAELAGLAADSAAAVIRGSITTTRKYKGVKLERKRRKE